MKVEKEQLKRGIETDTELQVPNIGREKVKNKAVVKEDERGKKAGDMVKKYQGEKRKGGRKYWQ